MHMLATPTISMCAVHTDGTRLLTNRNTLTVKQKIDIIQADKGASLSTIATQYGNNCSET